MLYLLLVLQVEMLQVVRLAGRGRGCRPPAKPTLSLIFTAHASVIHS